MHAIIVAGPNGSGKTTFADEFCEAQPGFVYLGADRIAEEISPENIAKAKIAAGRLFHKRLHEFSTANKDLIIETTLSGRSSVKMAETLKAAGYNITLFYLFLDNPNTCASRVELRVKTGGHDVPKADIYRRFYRSKNIFWEEVRKLVNEWLLIYNAENTSLEVAAGDASGYTVSHEPLFSSFLDSMEPSNA